MDITSYTHSLIPRQKFCCAYTGEIKKLVPVRIDCNTKFYNTTLYCIYVSQEDRKNEGEVNSNAEN